MHSKPSPSDPPPSQCPEPIAIVGMGCRWPGGVRTPSALWTLLAEKRDGFAEFTPDRINLRGFYHPDGKRPGSMFTKGGFLLDENPRDFDHTFFGMSATETLTLDPSQRKLLEVTFEAFESAGVPLERIAGTRTGVFVGNFNNEHQTMLLRDTEQTLPYTVTGGGPTILSNRINYVFDLRGPSMMVDTACSASMYALHLAVLAIRNGDCSGAIVAGANVILGPDNQIFTTKLGAVSSTSRCHTFDVSADGYARAEGFGAFYLKKLSDAIADGDPIRALIRGTSFNANGRTGGISHPSPDGQEAVMRQAYRNAGNLNPDLTGYVECHGTGTPVGDPIEVSAVGRVFSPGRTTEPLLIGSIKPNLGHSEAASAMSQIMKCILSMEHGEIPATIGITKFNPDIDFQTAKVKVVTEQTPWPTNLLRRASINSFGYGGANAHCILDHPSVVIPGFRLHGTRRSDKTSVPKSLPSVEVNGHTNGHVNSHSNGHTNGNVNGHDSSTSWNSSVEVTQVDQAEVRPYVLLPVSAHDDQALKSKLAEMSTLLSEFALPDVLYTLSRRTSNFSRRAFVVGEPKKLGSDELVSDSFVLGRAPSARSKRIGFIFTGQGAQWPQMGLRLLEEYTVFRQTIRYLDDVLSRLSRKPDWTIEGALQEPADTSRINDPLFSQTICTALQVALVALLRQWGITAVATVGHSSGEIAASYCAGHLKASEAIVLAYIRGRVVSTNERRGLMMACGLGQEDVQPFLQDFEGKIKVAAVNSPGSVTLSGEPEAIEGLSKTFTGQGIFARVLKTGGNAYHSHHMKALGGLYEHDAAESLLEVREMIENEPCLPPLKWVSSVTSEEQTEHASPEYWRRNLESSVLFFPAVETLVKTEELDLLIEIGPHPALGGPLKQIRTTLEETGVVLPPCLASLRRGEHDVVSMLTLAGNLFINDAPINLVTVNATESQPKGGDHGAVGLQCGFQCIDLLQYPYSYPDEPIIFENRVNKEYRTRKHPRHDLLGARVPAGSRNHPQWKGVLRLKDVPWLEDHKLLPHPVLPGAAYLVMAVEAVTQLHKDEAEQADVPSSIKAFKLRQVAIKSTLKIEDTDMGVEVFLTMQKMPLTTSAASSRWYSFSIASTVPGEDMWTEHCTGTICAVTTEQFIEDDQKLRLDPRSRSLDITRWHRRFADAGLGYGPTFQGLSNLQAYRACNIAGADVALRATAEYKAESSYPIHPTALDTCIQLALIACNAGQVENLEKAFVPVFADNVTIWNSPEHHADSAQGVASGSSVGLRSISARVQLHYPDSQAPLLDIGELRCVTYDGAQDEKVQIPRRPYWRPVSRVDSDTLTTPSARALFPPETLPTTMLAELDTLAAHITASIGHELSVVDRNQEEMAGHEQFAEWIRTWLSSSAPSEVVSVPDQAERVAVIEKLAAGLQSVPEANCLKILHDNIGRILGGETNNLKVLLESTLWAELYDSGLFVKAAYTQLQHLVDLLAHKCPRLRILEVGAGSGGATAAILDTLSAGSPSKRFEQYVFTDSEGWCVSDAKARFSDYGSDLVFKTLDVLQDPLSQGFEEHSFDLVIAAGCLMGLEGPVQGLSNIQTLMKPSGSLILMETLRSSIAPELIHRTLSARWSHDQCFVKETEWDNLLQRSGFSGTILSLQDYAGEHRITKVMLSKVQKPERSTDTPPQTSDVYLVTRDSHTPFLAEILAADLEKNGRKAILKDLLVSHEIPSKALVISLVDLAGSTVARRDEVHFKAIQAIVREASAVLWVASDLHQPAESSIMKGLLRSISVENVTCKYCFVEIDHGFFTPQARAAGLILAKLDQMRDPSSPGLDGEVEFVLRSGLFYIERFVLEEGLNDEYRRRHRLEDNIQRCIVADQEPWMARYGQPGLLSSLYFIKDPDFDEPLHDDWVEIKTEAIGLNMKDLAVATARFDLNKLSTEAAGVVTRIGSAVESLQVGDRVFGMIPGNMGNFVRSPASLIAKIPEQISAEGAASMPVVFLTSIYALQHLAHVGKGDSILIQSATGGLGMAAIEVARHLGAEIFATVGNAEKRKVLVEEYGIPESHIFNSRSIDVIDEIMKVTQRKGIDVILSAAGGDMMHEMWRCLAPLGRFIDVGRTDVLGGGRLGLEVFKRNATFSSFDMGLIYRQNPVMIQRLMAEMCGLISQGVIGPIKHLTSYDISKLESAMSYFSKGSHIGKLVITFKDPGATLKIVRPVTRASFDPNAAYLLIGCLGGLGRSLAAWMVERGARHLVFLSRSGSTRPEAGSVVKELVETGAEPQVIKCDVTDQQAVVTAVKQVSSKLQVKGVIHAAMVEGDAFFNETTLSQVHSVLAPKAMGTVNLHEATKHLDLDFFLMTSSIIGSVGTATQGAYTAANAFQDAFARYRISQSLPATALGLGLILEVGSVSNSVSFQQMLQRNATYGISETEFLRLFEGALCESKLTGQASHLSKLDSSCTGQVVTGLEAAQFVSYVESDRAEDLIWFKNARFQSIAQATSEAAQAHNSASKQSGSETYRSRIEEASTSDEKIAIAREAVATRIADLLSINSDDIDVAKPISHYGVDSLVAGELRNWLIRSFDKEITLLQLLDKGTKIDDVVKKAAGV